MSVRAFFMHTSRPRSRCDRAAVERRRAPRGGPRGNRTVADVRHHFRENPDGDPAGRALRANVETMKADRGAPRA
jgi:hypothetical protein